MDAVALARVPYLKTYLDGNVSSDVQNFFAAEADSCDDASLEAHQHGQTYHDLRSVLRESTRTVANHCFKSHAHIGPLTNTQVSK
jgi:hypothetical protein